MISLGRSLTELDHLQLTGNADVDRAQVDRVPAAGQVLFERRLRLAAGEVDLGDDVALGQARDLLARSADGDRDVGDQQPAGGQGAVVADGHVGRQAQLEVDGELGLLAELRADGAPDQDREHEREDGVDPVALHVAIFRVIRVVDLPGGGGGGAWLAEVSSSGVPDTSRSPWSSFCGLM